jgi:hypothetical protein
MSAHTTVYCTLHGESSSVCHESSTARRWRGGRRHIDVDHPRRRRISWTAEGRRHATSTTTTARRTGKGCSSVRRGHTACNTTGSTRRTGKGRSSIRRRRRGGRSWRTSECCGGRRPGWRHVRRRSGESGTSGSSTTGRREPGVHVPAAAAAAAAAARPHEPRDTIAPTGAARGLEFR